EARRLRGKLGIATARLAYDHWRQTFRGKRWRRLARVGATPQRCLWASTSLDDPAYRDVMYVEELIGAETITTLSERTLEAFHEHGRVDGGTLRYGLGEALSISPRLVGLGIDVEQITRALERDGIDRFATKFAATPA